MLDIKEAQEYLCEVDSKLASVFYSISEITHVERGVDFPSTVKIIVSQQLSLKAADTIFGRVSSLLDDFTPIDVLGKSELELRSCGLSSAKVRYIRSLAERCVAKPGYLNSISKLSDEEAAKEIQSNPGFGPWSAEIFLLFHLGRPNIFPKGDATLNRAIGIIYGIDVKDQLVLDSITRIWEPYRSLACLALWKWIDEGMPSKT